MFPILVVLAALRRRLTFWLPLFPLQNAKQLRLSRKASLLSAAAAGLLPSEIEGVKQGLLLPGYVASVTADAVFVR